MAYLGLKKKKTKHNVRCNTDNIKYENSFIPKQFGDQNMEPHLNMKISLCKDNTECIFVKLWNCPKKQTLLLDSPLSPDCDNCEDINSMIMWYITIILTHYRKKYTKHNSLHQKNFKMNKHFFIQNAGTPSELTCSETKFE